jgi:predicted aldo/keto reductase-like oxidoreductase
MKQAALKWVLSNPDISNLIITIVNKKQVDEYAKAAGSELAAEDREILKYYAKAYGDQVCTMCNECESSCPYNLQIANILRYYMYSDNYGLKEQGQLAYAAIPAAFRADQCLNCDAPCEQSCDAGVKVKREMTKAHESLNIG